MKSKNVFVVVGAMTIGLFSPMAMADNTNSYFNTNTNASSCSTAATQSSTLIEGTNSSTAVIEKTVSTPVLIEKSSSPVVIEDRIVKQKHLFGIGIWPLFDFEIL
jgi:hypothetical protein